MILPIGSMAPPLIRLSICIATYGRAGFIGQTLESILTQVGEQVEVVVVDGASPDDTSAVVGTFLSAYPRLVYRREASNEGVDRDFDKAVQYARGEYCWLMSDDDVLAPDAVATVLARLACEPELVVVNAEIRSKDMTLLLKPSQLEVSSDLDFDSPEHERLFAVTAGYLSFIGAVVIRRSTWLARDRVPYFGSLFIHVGVIFQPPVLGRAIIIARPLIRIRYGNAMWSARGFEIWIDKWPRLVWSFDQFSDKVKRAVTPRDPASSLKVLLHYRALGAYGLAEYEAFFHRSKRAHHWLAKLVARLPAPLVNTAIALYCLARKHPNAGPMLYELHNAKCASALTRWAARRFRFPETEK